MSLHVYFFGPETAARIPVRDGSIIWYAIAVLVYVRAIIDMSADTFRIPQGQNVRERTPTRHPSRAGQPPASTRTTSPAPSAANLDAQFELARNIVQRSAEHRRSDDPAVLDQKLRDDQRRRDMESQMVRRWKVGDVYSPHDLSPEETSKWKRVRRQPRVPSSGRDVLDLLRIDPRKHYKNFSMMNEYVSEMGRIKHRNETGLRPVNQRRMAKAIRRAVGTGVLMPTVYKHPELLKLDIEAREAMSRW